MLTENEVMSVYINTQKILEKIISYRTGSKQVGQDLTQDLYFKVIDMAQKFPTTDDTRNYLIRMAINSSIDYRRVEYRRSEILKGVLAIFETKEYLPEYNTELLEELELIESSMNTLPEKSRTILYLSRIEGLTHKEISEILNVSQSTIEKHIIRALTHCRDNLV
jgi:RNA polymerase sigma-70 factor (ECF subfamily)